MVTPLTDRWLRFNDVDVDEFLMSDVTVETECFGGTYKPKQNEGNEGEVCVRVCRGLCCKNTQA